MYELTVTSKFQLISSIIWFSNEEFEDTKKVIRIRKSKKNQQHNGQKKKYIRTNNKSTKHTQKTKDRVTQTHYKTLIEVKLVQHEDCLDLLWSYHAAPSVAHYCLIILLLIR